MKVYGQMQFADYVVGYALQTLSRCLLKVRGRDGALSCADERMIAQNTRQILSLWNMAEWSVGKLPYERACARLEEVVYLCSESAAAETRGAQQIIDALSGKSLETLASLVSGVPGRRRPEDQIDRISCLLQDESANWRDSAVFRQIADADLITYGIVRAYENTSRASSKLNRSASDGNRPAGAKTLRRARYWIGHSVNHGELLRPALSEKGRLRGWHLSRLYTRVEKQHELECVAALVSGATMKPKHRTRIERAIRQRRRSLEKQRLKLSGGAFGDAGFRHDAQSAVDQLALSEISVLPVAAGQK